MSSQPKVLNELNYAMVLASDIELMIADNQGEITPALEEKIKSIDLMKAEAVEGALELIEDLSFKIERHYQLQEAIGRKAESLAKFRSFVKAHLESAMKASETKKLQGVARWATLVKNRASVVLNETFHIPEFMKTKTITTIVPDKELIRADLESGKKVEGAALVQTYRVDLYPRTPKKEEI